MITKNIKKKILFVTPYFKPRTGGMENYVANIEGGLSTLDWETVVVTSNSVGQPYQEETVDGTKVYRLPTWFKVSNTPVNPIWFFYLKKIIAKEKPDLINGHAPVPFISDLAAMAAGSTPFVLTYHAGTMKKKRLIFDIIIWLYENILLKATATKAVKIICPSNFVINTILKQFKNKSVVITPGVDVQSFKPVKGDTEKNNTLLFIARYPNMYKMKGLYTLIEAMKSLPDITLRVVGEPINIDAPNVVFLGVKPMKEVIAEMQKCSIFLLPSLAHAESFGMVLIEAMACLKPVIGTRIGGIPEVIRDGIDGIIVESENAPELASAIRKLIDNPNLAQQYAKNGYDKIQLFYTWEIKVNETNELFQNITMNESGNPKIVHVSAYYPPHTGGMENVAEKLAEYSNKEGYEVEVLTSDQGVRMIEKENTLNKKNKVSYLWSFEFAHTPFAPSLLWHLFKIKKGSIIHLHLAQAYWPELVWLVSKIKGIPYIIHFHLDVGPSGIFGSIFLLYKKYILGWIIRGATRVIVFSNEQSELVQNKYGVKPDVIAIVPNGVGEEFFSYEPRNFLNKELRLLYVGRLSAQKRVERLINAMALIKTPCSLSVVGDGEDREKLEELVKNLGLKNVFFMGKKSGAELVAFYKNSDIFVISSDREGMPLVVLEAMAAGLPIVGSNVIGIKELIAGVGVLVDDPSAESFAGSLNNLLNNPEALLKLSEQSLEKAEKYSWKRLIAQLLPIYKEII